MTLALPLLFAIVCENSKKYNIILLSHNYDILRFSIPYFPSELP